MKADAVVYVDSGSTDGSADYARSIGVGVVDLDMSLPFNAGRARNAGFSLLSRTNQGLKYVQFVDGDCELSEGWISTAKEFLEARQEYAIVIGRLKERNPKASVYNTLCDVEWTRPEGDVPSCGGIFMVRSAAFSACGGFNETMIAGEEPELSFRLREAGWRLYCLSRPMATHDAAIYRFSQWWRRTVRGGYAYAHRCSLHIGKNDSYLRVATMRVWFWALGIPALAVALWPLFGPWSTLVFLGYFYKLMRGYTSTAKVFGDRRASFLYAAFSVIGGWAQLAGQIDFLAKNAFKKGHKIMEYK